MNAISEPQPPSEPFHRAKPKTAYEAHVTVAAPDAETVAHFAAVCRQAHIKHILIELPEGATPVQPMTATHHPGPLDSAVSAAYATAARLSDSGFDVVRVKVEALGSSPEAPETDAEALQQPDRYFELHALVALEPSDDVKALDTLVAANGGRLSTNVHKRDRDGRVLRYVTLRVYRVGRVTANRRFASFLDAVRGAGYPLSRVRREFAVYDSNLALDAGWIPMPEPQGGRL